MIPFASARAEHVVLYKYIPVYSAIVLMQLDNMTPGSTWYRVRENRAFLYFNTTKQQIENKWSKMFDERPHRRGTDFSRRQCNSPTQTLSNGTLKPFYSNNVIPVFIIGRFYSFLYCAWHFVTRCSCFYNCKRWTVWIYELKLTYESWYIIAVGCSSVAVVPLSRTEWSLLLHIPQHILSECFRLPLDAGFSPA